MKKVTQAKKFAEIEKISVFGAVARIGPVGLWMYANAYASSVKALAEPSVPFEPVRYYLACHSIELSLKAYLSLHGATMLELSESKMSHSLEKALDEAEAKGLLSAVHLSVEQRAEVRKANHYYNGKLFEYPAYGEAMRGYPDLPKIALLVETASALADALAQPCREAQ